MLQNLRRFITNSILVIAAACTGWLLIRYALTQPSVHYNHPETPDAFAQAIDAVRMDENGNVLNQLLSPYMLHYATNDKTTLTSPHLIIYSENKQPWQVVAQTGQALQGLTTIELSRNVKLYQKASASNPDTTLLTEQLTLFPEQKQAETNQPVTISQPSSQVNSIGMKVDLNKNTVDLLSNVRGQYAPRS